MYADGHHGEQPAARRDTFISEAEGRRGLAALDQDARRRAAITARASTIVPDAAPSDLRRRGVVQFTLADRENMSEVFAASRPTSQTEGWAAGARDFTLEQPKLEDVFMRVVARAAGENVEAPAPAAAANVETSRRRWPSRCSTRRPATPRPDSWRGAASAWIGGRTPF